MKKALVCMMMMLPLAFAGCEIIPIFGPAVNAYVAWRAGEGHAYFATDSRTAYKAVKRTVAKFEYPVHADEDKGDGDYYVEVGENDRFKINVVKIEPFISKVSIRVNFMGDKPYADLIFTELQDQLDIIDYREMPDRLNRYRSD